MVDPRQHALKLLDKITPKKTKTRNTRLNTFLVSPSDVCPDYKTLPENWPGGWCEGWAYAIGPNFATALDLQLTKRVQPSVDEYGHKVLNDKGKPVNRAILVWTQGSAFSFGVGYTIYKTPKAYSRWGEALDYVDMALQIRAASPAVPAHVDIATYATESEMLEAAERFKELYELALSYPKKEGDPFCIKIFVPRDPGKVQYEVYEILPTEHRLVSHEPPKLYRTTQDGFVRMLISGLPES